MLSFSRPIQTDGSMCSWKMMLGLAVCVVLSGCSGENKPDIGGAGKLIGQNVTEFAQGVGTGVDQQLQVVVELSTNLRRRAFRTRLRSGRCHSTSLRRQYQST